MGKKQGAREDKAKGGPGVGAACQAQRKTERGQDGGEKREEAVRERKRDGGT